MGGSQKFFQAGSLDQLLEEFRFYIRLYQELYNLVFAEGHITFDDEVMLWKGALRFTK